MTNKQNASFGLQVTAIVLMAGGWGWDSGQFVQPFFANFFGGFIDIVHFTPALLLAFISPTFLRASALGQQAKGSRNWINGIVVFSLLSLAVLTVLGLTNPNPNSVGVHTFEDTLPVIVLVAGSLLWIVSLFTARQQAAHATTANHVA